MLDKKLFGEGFFRNIFLFPMALSFVVTGVIWQWLLNPSTGFNDFLAFFNIQHYGTPIQPFWEAFSGEK